MRARDVMSVNVVTVEADASLLEAAELLVNFKVSALPVIERTGPLSGPRVGTMVGIVSEADLMGEAEAAAAALGRRKVSDVMPHDVVTAMEDTPVDQLVGLMKRHNIKRVPILREGAVVGIVSRTDILRGLISLSHGTGHVETLTGPTSNGDEALRHEVYAACRGRRWSAAKRMDVVVHDGVAHLWGLAPSDLVRQAYRVAAQNVAGVKRVELHMHVVQPQHSTTR